MQLRRKMDLPLALCSCRATSYYGDDVSQERSGRVSRSCAVCLSEGKCPQSSSAECESISSRLKTIAHRRDAFTKLQALLRTGRTVPYSQVQEAQFDLASAYHSMGESNALMTANRPAAETHFKEAIRLLNTYPPQRDPPQSIEVLIRVLRSRLALSALYEQWPRYDDALNVLEAAADSVRSLASGQGKVTLMSKWLVRLLVLKGRMYIAKATKVTKLGTLERDKCLSAAIRLFQEALKLDQNFNRSNGQRNASAAQYHHQLPGSENNRQDVILQTETARIQHNLAVAFNHSKQFEKAVENSRAELSIRGRVFGEKSVYWTACQLLLSYSLQGQAQAQLEENVQSIVSRVRVHGLLASPQYNNLCATISSTVPEATVTVTHCAQVCNNIAGVKTTEDASHGLTGAHIRSHSHPRKLVGIQLDADLNLHPHCRRQLCVWPENLQWVATVVVAAASCACC
jgi:tetratricopeptide (TPR) repeat protein